MNNTVNNIDIKKAYPKALKGKYKGHITLDPKTGRMVAYGKWGK